MFNTFPTQSSQDESGSGGGSSSTGSEPSAVGEPISSFYSAGKANYLEGFASLPGGSILLPTTNTGNLVAYDSTGSIIFSHSPSNVGPFIDRWVGFWLNDDATILYVVGRDISGAPDIYYLVEVNSGGVGTVVGSDNIDDDFDGTADWTGGTSIIPLSGGGFRIISLGDSGGNVGISRCQFADIDSAGQFVTNRAQIFEDTQKDALLFGFSNVYESPDGFILNNLQEVTASGLVSFTISNKKNVVRVTVENTRLLGGSNTANCGFIRWRDYITILNTVDSERGAILKYPVLTFDEFLKDFGNSVGLE